MIVLDVVSRSVSNFSDTMKAGSAVKQSDRTVFTEPAA